MQTVPSRRKSKSHLLANLIELGNMVAVIFKYFQKHPLAAMLIALLFLIASLYHFAPHEVEIFVDGTPELTVRTFNRTVAELLDELDIQPGPNDKINPPGDSLLAPGTRVDIEKAFPVFIIADGAVNEVWATAGPPLDLVNEKGYQLGPWDRLELEGSDEVYPMSQVKIVRVKKEYLSRQVTVPYENISRGNPSLDRGMQRVISQGRDGLQQEVVEIVYEDGKEAGRSVVDTTILQEPVDSIEEYGENTTLVKGGRVFEFEKAFIMMATSYCPGTPASGCPIDDKGHAFCTGPYNDGYTYTGKKAVQGRGTLESPRMVAVDPRVIPLGSMLYLEGYGFARAEDIGGAIKGHKIDILFDRHIDVARFGVKYGVKVYLLKGL